MFEACYPTAVRDLFYFPHDEKECRYSLQSPLLFHVTVEAHTEKSSHAA